MMRLVILSIILAACIAAAATIAQDAFATPIPDDAGSDCGWFEHGTTIEIDDHSYTCHCAELTGPMGKQVLCRWYRDDVLPSRKAKKRIAKPKAHRHAVRAYPLPKVVG